MPEKKSELHLYDELTGLYNRRFFNRRLPEELENARHTQTPLSLCILDVDYFKDINDSYGHRAGDEALVKVSTLIKSKVRNTDTVFRYAGDEFAVVLSGTGNKTAMEIARDIAERVSGSSLTILDNKVNLSISIGVATYPKDGDNLSKLFDFADKALYARKRRGRNGACGRTEVYEDVNLFKPAFCPDIVGRKTEMTRLKEHLDLCLRGKGSLVLISGETGIGKTKLLTGFLDTARRRGCCIMTGRVFGEPTSFPYQAFKDALKKFCETNSSEIRELLQSLPETYRNELISLVPEFMQVGVEKGSVVDLEPDQAKLRLFDAVRQFIFNISKDMPVILALEDLHFADESSCQIFHYLARNLADKAVLMCGTYRTEELELQTHDVKPFAKVMRSMNRDHLFKDIRLQKLSREDTDRMIRLTLNTDEIPETFAQHIFRETEGVPFFIEEVLKSLIDERKIKSGSDLKTIDFDRIATPVVIRDVIQRRLDMLLPETQEVLGSASVIGDCFNFDVLQTVSKQNEGELLEHLSHAMRSQLINEEVEDEFRFTHGKIHQTIYEGIAKRKRLVAHKNVGKAIEHVYANSIRNWVSELARHFNIAKEWRKAFEYSCQAGKQSDDIHAHKDTLLHYNEALHAYQELEQHAREELYDRVIEVYENMGNTMILLSKYDEAVEVFEKLNNMARQKSDRNEEGKALNRIGAVYIHQELYDKALEYIRESLSIAEETDDLQLLVKNLSGIGVIHRFRGFYKEALQYYEKTLELAHEAHAQGSIALSMNNIGAIHAIDGKYDDALKYYDDSLALAKDLKDEKLITINYNNIGVVHRFKGNYDVALRYHSEALNIVRRIGDKKSIIGNLNSIGEIHWFQGMAENARKYHNEALEILREIGDREGIITCLMLMAPIHISSGHYDTAILYYEESLQLARDIDDKRRIADCLYHAGRVYYGKSMYDKSLQYHQDALKTKSDINDKRGVAAVQLSLGKLNRKLGRWNDALKLHQHSLTGAQRTGDLLLECIAMKELALDYLETGKVDEAKKLVKQSCEIAAKTGDSVAELNAAAGLCELYVKQGEFAAADETISKFMKIAEKKNAAMYMIWGNLLKSRYIPAQEAESIAMDILKQSENNGSREFHWRAHKLLWRILSEKNDPQKAAFHFEQAQNIFQSIVAEISDRDMRKSYLSLSEHQELLPKNNKS